MAELYSAAYHGSLEIVQVLLKKKDLDINWRHPQGGATALYVACEFGHIQVAQLLVAAGAAVDAARDDGATPLYKACQDGGKPAVARLLVKAGAKVNQQDKSGMTPLWLSVHHGCKELVELLLEAGGDATYRVQGWSVLDLAKREGHQEIARLLISKLPESELSKPSPADQAPNQSVELAGGGQWPKRAPANPMLQLYAAAHHGDHGALRKILVAEGIDVDALPPEWPATALHVSCAQGHVTTAKMLLEAGAQIDKGHKHGQTPLAVACARGHGDVVRLLLAAQANLEIASRDGSTALSVACFHGHKELVRLLLEHGAEPGQLPAATGGGQGASPLIAAASMGKLACVRLLLEEEGLPLHLQWQGHTALEWARAKGHASCVKAIERAMSAGGVTAEDGKRGAAVLPDAGAWTAVASAGSAPSSRSDADGGSGGHAHGHAHAAKEAHEHEHGGEPCTHGHSEPAPRGGGRAVAPHGHDDVNIAGGPAHPHASEDGLRRRRVDAAAAAGSSSASEDEEESAEVRPRQAPRDFTVDEAKKRKAENDEWWSYFYLTLGEPPAPLFE
jgi:ankyrin repeat protein